MICRSEAMRVVAPRAKVASYLSGEDVTVKAVLSSASSVNTGAGYQNAGTVIGPPTIPGAVNFGVTHARRCRQVLEVRRVARAGVDERGDDRRPRLGDELQGARDARPRFVHLTACGRDRDEALARESAASQVMACSSLRSRHLTHTEP
jgi:hypothetical protein